LYNAGMAFEIVSTGSAVPEQRFSNDDLAKRIDTTDEWIRSHTGIGARHIAGPEIVCSDLAAAAAEKAVAQLAEKTGETAGEVKASLDFIILATVTADYTGFPSTACVIQDKIGAKNAFAFDISAACTGMIYSMEIASALLAFDNSRRRALITGTELLSRIVDWEDRSTCVLFGDAAAAAIIEKTPAPREGEGRRGLVRSVLKADGSAAGALYFPAAWEREPFRPGVFAGEIPSLKMDGHTVYNFAVKAITSTIKELLDKDGITLDKVRWIIPHQANARIVAAAQKRLSIPKEKIYMNIEEYGNTGAASIGVALDELNRAGKLERGDLILLVGFGSGMTFGGNLIVW